MEGHPRATVTTTSVPSPACATVAVVTPQWKRAGKWAEAVGRLPSVGGKSGSAGKQQNRYGWKKTESVWLKKGGIVRPKKKA